MVALINFATHVTFPTKEIKLLAEKGKPSESNQCDLERRSSCFRHSIEMCESKKGRVKADDREGFDTRHAGF